LLEAPVLALPDHSRPFSVVCDASDFAIGCALLQQDESGIDRAISYQSRQLRAAELNYPVHDKELLAIKYALMKFRIYLLGGKPFVVYTDHASLRTAINSPHLSQRMARWLAFFAEYNFTVAYKPGRLNRLRGNRTSCFRSRSSDCSCFFRRRRIRRLVAHYCCASEQYAL
jgi:RNase H-like domain found in reverse transcriptase